MGQCLSVFKAMAAHPKEKETQLPLKKLKEVTAEERQGLLAAETKPINVKSSAADESSSMFASTGNHAYLSEDSFFDHLGSLQEVAGSPHHSVNNQSQVQNKGKVRNNSQVLNESKLNESKLNESKLNDSFSQNSFASFIGPPDNKSMTTNSKVHRKLNERKLNDSFNILENKSMTGSSISLTGVLSFKDQRDTRRSSGSPGLAGKAEGIAQPQGTAEDKKEAEKAEEAQIRAEDEAMASSYKANVTNAEKDLTLIEGLKVYNIDAAHLEPETVEAFYLTFECAKYDPEATLKKLSYKNRVLAVDMCGGNMINMKSDGKTIQKSHNIENLLTMTKHTSSHSRIQCKFDGANHPYEFVMNSGMERDRFHQAMSAIRPNQEIWCPSLVRPNCDHSLTTVHVDMMDLILPMGGTKTLNGQVTFNAQTKALGHLNVWTGMFRHPQTYTMLEIQKTIPQRMDIVAVVNGQGQLAAKFIGDLAEVMHTDYHRLSASCASLSVFVAKRAIRFITNVERADVKGDPDKAVLHAISFKYQETSFCFIAATLPQTYPDTATKQSAMRDLLKGAQLGVPSFDVLMQFDRIFLMLNDHAQNESICSKMKETGWCLGFQDPRRKPDSKRLSAAHSEELGRTDSAASISKDPESENVVILYKSLNTQASIVPGIDEMIDGPDGDLALGFQVPYQRVYGSIFCEPSPPVRVLFGDLSIVGFNHEGIKGISLLFWSHIIDTQDKQCISGEVNIKSLQPHVKIHIPTVTLPVLTPIHSNLELLSLNHIFINIMATYRRTGSAGQGMFAGTSSIGTASLQYPSTLGKHNFTIPVMDGGVCVAKIVGNIDVSLITRDSMRSELTAHGSKANMKRFSSPRLSSPRASSPRSSSPFSSPSSPRHSSPRLY